jgi:hypothetical protein
MMEKTMFDIDPLRFSPITEEFAERTNYGHSIRRERDPNREPKYPTPIHHFLLYVRDTDQGIDARKMWDPYFSNIADSEKSLFHLAKGPKPTPSYLGRGFSGMLWKYPCIVTIVLDNDNYEFRYNDDVNDPEGEPIVFYREKNGIQFHPNHTFYNAAPVTVPILNAQGHETGAVRHGLRFENHLKKDDNGNDLKHGDQPKRYKFDLVVMEPVIGENPVPVSTDPDGSNQGPPGVP